MLCSQPLVTQGVNLCTLEHGDIQPIKLIQFQQKTEEWEH